MPSWVVAPYAPTIKIREPWENRKLPQSRLLVSFFCELQQPNHLASRFIITREKLAECHNSGINDEIQTEVLSKLSKLANNGAIFSLKESHANADIFITITKDVSS